MRRRLKMKRRREFDPSAEYVARYDGAIRFEDGDLLAGQDVPLDRLTEREAMLAYVYRRIVRKGSAEAPAAAPLAATSGYEARHRGAGRWHVVDAGGTPVFPPEGEPLLSREEAERAAEALNSGAQE